MGGVRAAAAGSRWGAAVGGGGVAAGYESRPGGPQTNGTNPTLAAEFVAFLPVKPTFEPSSASALEFVAFLPGARARGQTRTGAERRAANNLENKAPRARACTFKSAQQT
jgi:hypothetical protein